MHTNIQKSFAHPTQGTFESSLGAGSSLQFKGEQDERENVTEQSTHWSHTLVPAQHAQLDQDLCNVFVYTTSVMRMHFQARVK